MPRRVSQKVAQLSFQTIRIVGQAMLDGETAISYAQLAKRLGMSNITGQGLKSYLDEATARCFDNDLPDVSSVVVTKDSMNLGLPMPSEDSFVDGTYSPARLRKEDIPHVQKAVRDFDWKSVKALNLS